MTDVNPQVLRDRVGIDPDDYSEALYALASGHRAWVVVSGKMCAGKDTVAPELAAFLPQPVTMLRYGSLMRAELATGLDHLRNNTGKKKPMLALDIADLMDLSYSRALQLVDTLVPELVASDGTLTPESRTDGIRTMLQNLGADWRTLDDESYWARKAAVGALDLVASGSSVILTGGRFRPDVELPAAAAAILLRIDVTRATQLERLRGRDNLEVGPETLKALQHSSETALDDWDGFSLRVNNDADLDVCIAAARRSVAAIVGTRRIRSAAAHVS